MPWTPPIAVIAGDALDAPTFNAQIINNLRYLKGEDTGGAIIEGSITLANGTVIVLGDQAATQSPSPTPAGAVYRIHEAPQLQIIYDALMKTNLHRELIGEGHFTTVGTATDTDDDLEPLLGFDPIINRPESEETHTLESTTMIWKVGNLIDGVVGRSLVRLTIQASALPAGNQQASILLISQNESNEGTPVALTAATDATLTGTLIPEKAANNPYAVIQVFVKITNMGNAIDTSRNWSATQLTLKGERRPYIPGFDLKTYIVDLIQANPQTAPAPSAPTNPETTRYQGSPTGTILKSGNKNFTEGTGDAYDERNSQPYPESAFTCAHSGTIDVHLGVNPAGSRVYESRITEQINTGQTFSRTKSYTYISPLANYLNSPINYPTVKTSLDSNLPTNTPTLSNGQVIAMVVNLIDGTERYVQTLATWNAPESDTVNSISHTTTSTRISDTQYYDTTTITWNFIATRTRIVTVVPAGSYLSSVGTVWVLKNGVRFRRLRAPSRNIDGHADVINQPTRAIQNNRIQVSASDVIQLEPFVGTFPGSSTTQINFRYAYRANTVTS